MMWYKQNMNNLPNVSSRISIISIILFFFFFPACPAVYSCPSISMGDCFLDRPLPRCPPFGYPNPCVFVTHSYLWVLHL